MPDEANFILHLQPSRLTPKSYSDSERHHQSMQRQQHCPDLSPEKILPTRFHDHLHLEPLLIHKPCPSTSQETTWFHFNNSTGFHQKNINDCPILSNLISVFSVGKRYVGVTNPPLAQFDIFFLLQECNRLSNSKFSFTFLTFLDKTKSITIQLQALLSEGIHKEIYQRLPKISTELNIFH